MDLQLPQEIGTLVALVLFAAKTGYEIATKISDKKTNNGNGNSSLAEVAAARLSMHMQNEERTLDSLVSEIRQTRDIQTEIFRTMGQLLETIKNK